MKNATLVAWGLIVSVVISILTGMELLVEQWFTIAGLGMFTFGIWAAVILLKNADNK